MYSAPRPLTDIINSMVNVRLADSWYHVFWYLEYEHETRKLISGHGICIGDYQLSVESCMLLFVDFASSDQRFDIDKYPD